MGHSGLTALVVGLASWMGGQALAETAAIETAQSSWEAAFASGDGVKAGSVFTEDARLLPPGEPLVEGREAIGQYWQAGFDAGVRDLRLGLTTVDMIGDDTMIETGTWTVNVPTETGGHADVSGKALVVWKKEADGVWRMSRDMWSQNE